MLTDPETKFKASALHTSGIHVDALDKVADAIVKLFLGTGITFTLPKDTPVINPAYFLSLVRNAA